MMKWFAPFAIVLFLAGCSDDSEHASMNMKKGDTFFAKQQYEVAEYYYDKIPEDSPLRVTAAKKLKQIEEIKRQWVERTVPQGDLTKIHIIDHTWTMDNVRLLPAHRLSLVNNTTRDLEAITVEFAYYDESGAFVQRLTTEVEAQMFVNTQDVFKGIEPGVVKKKFTKATAVIIGAKFQ